MLTRYRNAVRRVGGRLPGVPELNLLFDTAYQSRCAAYLAAFACKLFLRGNGVGPPSRHTSESGLAPGLAEIEGWFQDVRPLLPRATRRLALPIMPVRPNGGASPSGKRASR